MGFRRGKERALRLMLAVALVCVFGARSPVAAGAAETGRWRPLDPESIREGDEIAITMEREDGLWALDTGGGAVGASLEAGQLVCPGAETAWRASLEEGTLILRPKGSGDWLYYTELLEDGLGVGREPDGHWLVSRGLLQHYQTDGWLCLTGEAGKAAWTVAADHAAARGQTLRFWAPAPEKEPSPVPSLPAEDLPEEEEEPFELPEMPWSLYSGQLHAHTDLSDGRGSVEEAFQSARAAGLDFFAVTDHSTSFDGAGEARLEEDASALSEKWARGRAAAAASTDGDFVGLFGFEMTWPDSLCLGHISTFATPGFLSTDRPDLRELAPYYEALSAAPGSIGMFAHPGLFYGDFEDFAHRTAAYDAHMSLLEVSGEAGARAFDAYTDALDAGWHVAPAAGGNEHSGNWGRTSPARTVVLAEERTEESLYEALRSRRTYASEDSDLTLLYTLNGAVMGTVLPFQEEAVLEVWLEDPTDPIGRVEVIAEGGETAAWEDVEDHQAVLSFDLPGDLAYYYIRVTQPDGDMAVTAPVWLEGFPDLGVRELTVTGTPLRGRRAEAAVTLYDDEPVSMEVTELTISADGEVLYRLDAPIVLGPLEERTVTAAHIPERAGRVVYTVQARGSVEGAARRWERTWEVWYREPELTAGLLAWGLDADELKNLSLLAERQDMVLETVEDELPDGGSVLLIGPPEAALPEAFTQQVRAFAEQGGTVILCGRGGDPAAARSLNALLESLGSTLRLNGGRTAEEETAGTLFPDLYQVEGAGALAGQYFRQDGGCTVDPGAGTWLVKGLATDASGRKTQDAALLAWEETPWGGRILAAGCPFFTDSLMPLPKNAHTLPSANQRILEEILGAAREELPLSTVEEARRGVPGEIYRVRGSLTAGTSRKGNVFPGLVYLQDGLRGIAVTDFPPETVQVGQGMEVLGILAEEDGNTVLRCLRATRTETLYKHLPRPVSCGDAMDYDRYGGTYLQAEGTVETVDLTEDGAGVRRFTLRDEEGGLAVVKIEAYITAGSTGRNTLASIVHPGDTVRAKGILHMADGEPVLRVRDCEEVVTVPPVEPPPTEASKPTEPPKSTEAPGAETTKPTKPASPPKETTPPKTPAETKPASKPRPKNVKIWNDPDYVPEETEPIPERRLPWQHIPDPKNPKTGDIWGALLFWLP